MSSEIKWTASQRQAIEERNCDILISAGAGSGKTAVLTQRITSLIEEGAADCGELLVVTFTKAAAADMKKKIRASLARLCAQSRDPRHIEQLSRLEEARISTIHAFCSNVIKGFYQIAGCEPDFNIITDVRRGILKERALKEAFEELYLSGDENFAAFTDAYGTKADDGPIIEMVGKIYDKIQSRVDGMEFLRQAIEDMKSENSQEFFSSKAALLTSKFIEEELQDCLGIFREALNMAEKYDDTSKRGQIITSYMNEVDTLLLRLKNKGLGIFLEELGGFKFSPFKLKEPCPYSEEIKALVDEAKNIIGPKSRSNSLMNRFGFSGETYRNHDNKTHRDMLGLYLSLKTTDEIFKRLKAEQKSLDFDDLEHYCLKILENDQAREEIKSTYKYIFVDEYQDTNPLQEAIINALYSPGRLFTVGDVKQSIYGFRRAKPELFMERYDRYIGGGEGLVIRLTENFRSTSPIIEAVNELFGKIMFRSSGGIDYMAEEEALKAAGAYPSGEKPRLDVISCSKDEDAAAVQAAYTAKLVDSLLKQEIYDINSKGEMALRRVLPEDITILLRSMKRGNYYINALNEAGLPVNSPEAKEFYDLTEIALMVNILKVTDNYKDDIALGSVMRSFIYNFTPDDMVAITLFGAGKSFNEAFYSYAQSGPQGKLRLKAEKLTSDIAAFSRRAKKVSLKNLISEIYSKTNLPEYAATLPGGEVRKENLMKFRQIAAEYEESTMKGLYRFIDHAEAARLSGESFETHSRTAGRGVNVMTVHKSKGLQFNIVIIPECERRFVNDKDPIMLTDEMLCPEYRNTLSMYKANTLRRTLAKARGKYNDTAEEIRILYVAATRAKQRLYFIAAQREDRSANIASLLPPTPRRAKCASNWLSLIAGSFMGSAVANVRLGISPAAPIPAPAPQKAPERKILPPREKERLTRLLRERLLFVYPYLKDTLVPTKLSVSALKHSDEAEMGSGYAAILPPPSFAKEELIREGKAVYDSAARGTLTHKALQYLNLKALSDNLGEGVKEQLDNLTQEGRFTPGQREAIYEGDIVRFLQSDIGKALLNAEDIRRETEFIMALPPGEVQSEWEGATGKILIQGIIDLSFIYKGKRYIIDYKTDALTGRERFEANLRRYERQIRAYALAYCGLYGAAAEELYICYLRTGTNVRVEGGLKGAFDGITEGIT